MVGAVVSTPIKGNSVHPSKIHFAPALSSFFAKVQLSLLAQLLPLRRAVMAAPDARH